VSLFAKNDIGSDFLRFGGFVLPFVIVLVNGVAAPVKYPAREWKEMQSQVNLK
jgi:hypothetical protein